jgi:ribosomal protein S6E (S10)
LGDAITSVKIKGKKLTTKNIDGYCYVIESEKTTKGIKIYSGYNFLSFKDKVIEKDVCFVAKNKRFTAHGKTVKQAIIDVNFKIIADKLKKEPIKADTVITIMYYRTVTGACQSGVELWMQQNNIVKQEYKAKDLLPILEKTHAYGVEQFKQLCQF